MTLIDGGAHRLRIVDMDGDLVLSEGHPLRDSEGFTISTLGADADFGNPESFDVTIPSQMLNGADEHTERFGNRDLFFRVKVAARDGVGLALGEKALMERLYRRAELHWTPPAPASPTTVFQVVNSRLEATFDDVDELRVHRVYGIRLRALPFGKSTTPITEEIAAPGTITPVRLTGGLSSGPQSARFTGQWYSGELWVWSWTPAVGFSGTFAMEGMRYIRANVSASGSFTHPNGFVLSVSYKMYVDGVACPIIARQNNVIYCRAPQQSFSTIKVTAQVTGVDGPPPDSVMLATLGVGDVDRVDALPSSGKQATRLTDTEGSAPSPQAFEISHADTSLGDVIVFTSPKLTDGFVPDLRQWQTAGTVTSESQDTITGSYVVTPTFDVPMNLLPSGGFVLAARMAGPGDTGTNGPLTVDWSAGIRLGSRDVTLTSGRGYGTAIRRGSRRIFNVFVLGSFALPQDVPPSSDAVLRIKLNGSAADGAVSADVAFDEAWIFPTGPDDQVSLLRTGKRGTVAPGESSNRVWMEPAGLERNRPSVWMGVAPDRSDALHVTPYVAGVGGSQPEDGQASSALVWGEHRLPAGPGGIYVASSGVQATVRRTYVPHWHSNAAS